MNRTSILMVASRKRTQPPASLAAVMPHRLGVAITAVFRTRAQCPGASRSTVRAENYGMPRPLDGPRHSRRGGPDREHMRIRRDLMNLFLELARRDHLTDLDVSMALRTSRQRASDCSTIAFSASTARRSSTFSGASASRSTSSSRNGVGISPTRATGRAPAGYRRPTSIASDGSDCGHDGVTDLRACKLIYSGGASESDDVDVMACRGRDGPPVAGGFGPRTYNDVCREPSATAGEAQ